MPRNRSTRHTTSYFCQVSSVCAHISLLVSRPRRSIPTDGLQHRTFTCKFARTIPTRSPRQAHEWKSRMGVLHPNLVDVLASAHSTRLSPLVNSPERRTQRNCCDEFGFSGHQKMRMSVKLAKTIHSTIVLEFRDQAQQRFRLHSAVSWQDLVRVTMFRQARFMRPERHDWVNVAPPATPCALRPIDLSTSCALWNLHAAHTSSSQCQPTSEHATRMKQMEKFTTKGF